MSLETETEEIAAQTNDPVKTLRHYKEDWHYTAMQLTQKHNHKCN